MKHCPHCGEELPNDSFTFCPYCGKSTNVPPVQAAAQAQPSPQPQDPLQGQIPTQTMGVPVTTKPTKKKKPIIPIAIAAGLIILLVIGYLGITRQRELIFNSGDPIEIYVGDEGTIPVYGEGLEAADYQTALWSSGNSDVLTFNNGQYEALYDSSLFYEDSWDGADPASYTTTVSVTIEKGLRKWTGTADVKIILPQQEMPAGKILKKPADANGSTLTVVSSTSYSSYIYLKSKTKESNDMALVVGKGETTTFDLPADQYEMYIANGYNWYGEEYLFGPNTAYEKEEDEFDFYTYTYTLTIDIVGGNLNSEELDEEDFPEL